MTLDEAIKDIQRETRQYAKRQLTWFRKEPGFQWVNAGRKDELIKIAEELDFRLKEKRQE
jgi:tRNA dimethylallyltransferase